MSVSQGTVLKTHKFLFGIVLSYFLSGTFMEGFAATTPTVAPAVASASATPAVASAIATPALTPAAAIARPAVASTPAVAATPAFASTTPPCATPAPGQPKYDNYNHYNDMTSAQYYGSTGTPINPLRENDPVINPMPHSSVNPGKSKDYGTQYYSTLPQGVPSSQIKSGDEHLYILKSEIVPPVCPVCPAFPSASIVNKQDAPPCPPCGRCPESPFECKKVPNYNAVNSDSMPVPVLNDFSSFGM